VSKSLKVSILGAGNGAHAMAGHLALKGFSVKLYNKFEHDIVPMRERGGLQIGGVVEGFGQLNLISTDIAPVIDDAEVIMVVVPAFAHRFMAGVCAPHLRDGQVIVLNPGRTAGALEFTNVLRQQRVKAHVVVAEAQTLIYVCRISGPARVRILGIKGAVPLAALPAADTAAALSIVNKLYAQFVPAANVLETGLDNIGAVFHPSTMVLNAIRIDAGEEFAFYRGMTPMVASFLEVIDGERMAVAEAYGVRVESAKEWLIGSYEGISGKTLYECIQSNRAYAGPKSQKMLNMRYLTEDVPCGLVPIVSLAEVARVNTPATRGIVDVACALLKQDFWAEGRNLERLGLAGLKVEEIHALVERKSPDSPGRRRPLCTRKSSGDPLENVSTLLVC